MRETVQHPYNQQMMEYIRDRMEEEYSDIGKKQYSTDMRGGRGMAH